MAKTLVFIEGPAPTEIDISLACQHGTREFRLASAAEEPHDLAVASNVELIPKWGSTP